VKALICFFKGHQWAKIYKPVGQDKYADAGWKHKKQDTSIMRNLSSLFRTRLKCKRCGRER